MATDKQERTVIHLELGAEHHYFDSIKALCDHFGKEQIGITYKSLANIGITPDKPLSQQVLHYPQRYFADRTEGGIRKRRRIFFLHTSHLRYDFICIFGV
jgi:hypothetical protein